MRVYEALKNCTVSFRENDNTANDFVLYEGDFIFIQENIGWGRIQTGATRWDKYGSVSMLTKIYHKKLIYFGDASGDEIYEWTWIDVNIISPAINKEISIDDYDEYLTEILKDVTIQWNRENKLNLLNV
jgi:hypothetical protein